MRTYFHTALTALILLAATGCMIPPILFSPTRVHGYVRDMDGNPVTNAVVEATSFPPRLMPMTSPAIEHHVKTGKNGTWSYSERKVGRLLIEALPPVGYERAIDWTNQIPLSFAGPFYDGECPTNDIILMLKKLPAAPNQN